MINTLFNKRWNLLPVVCLVLLAVGCRKTEFATISNPTYIRVFNCLDINITLDNKDAPQPFLTMLIDPVLDADSVPVSAATTGDFLDTRADWARPYPDAANTTLYQKEYPGAAKVLAAPFLNGYDLSSWAQIPSGRHRIIFVSRPLNDVPYYQLDKSLRNIRMIDTTVDLTAGEVYTMHVLERNYQTRSTGLYIRNETFVKQPLSDSAVYMNFYNLSSEGYFAYSPDEKSVGVPGYKIRDTMNVYYTLRKSITPQLSENIPGFTLVPVGSMIRSQEPRVAKYYSFPLFVDTSGNHIYPGNSAQLIEFMRPGYALGHSMSNNSYALDLGAGSFLGLRIGPYGQVYGLDHSIAITADIRSGLIVTERSGEYNPRYFATVNTIEYINAKVYVTTIQRKFDPPVY